MYDRPNDDGTGLLLEFLPSTSSDVSKYEIYATDYEFNSVGIGSSGRFKSSFDIGQRLRYSSSNQ